MPDQSANLIAAACAAASWARARRAAWTDVPLALHATAPEDSTPPPPPFAASLATGPSVAVRAATRLRSLGALLRLGVLLRLGALLRRRLPLVVAATALLAASTAGGLYFWRAPTTSPTRVAVAVLEPSVRPPVPTRKPTGGLRVTSTPPGAQVLIDGKARGVTPLTLSNVIVGRHTIELKGDAGTVERTVIVAADKTAEIAESIFSGWLTVYSPFDLVITEDGRALRLDDRHQTMLSPGQHELRLINRALGYDALRQVEMKPGETTSLSVTPPPSTMTVTATEAAEVWLDGARVGEAPVNDWPVELGSHEIVVKRTVGGERRFTITMTVNPFILNVDFTKPAA